MWEKLWIQFERFTKIIEYLMLFIEVEESDDGWRIWFEIFEEKEVLALLIHDIFTSVNLGLLIDKSDLDDEE